MATTPPEPISLPTTTSTTAPPPTSTTTAEAASPPPSPPPPPPETGTETTATPGARATALQNAFAAALTATLSKCSYDNLAACFPTPARYRPATLAGFHADFTGRLGAVCEAEFAGILKERNVVGLLNGLDKLIADAKARREKEGAMGREQPVPVPAHTLPPEALVNAHLLPFLTEMRAGISKETAALETRNRALMETIRAQKREMEALVRGLEGVVADLEGSAGMVREVEGLGVEIGMVEGELKGV